MKPFTAQKEGGERISDKLNKLIRESGLLPENEPFMVILGRDMAATTALQQWIETTASLGGKDDVLLHVEKIQQLFANFSKNNPKAMKVADM